MRGKRAKKIRKLAADAAWSNEPLGVLMSGAAVHPDGTARRLQQGGKKAYMEMRSGLYSVVVA
jgi:hypothetical protein